MANNGNKIISPFPGFQENFVSSDVDFVIGGGAMGAGKSYAALLIAADQINDPDFRMVYIRRNLNDLRAGGGGTDDANKLYGSFANLKISENPRMTFPSGAFIDFTHMSDQTPDKVLERIRGWQYSCIYIDEGTGFEWSTIRLLLSRNRSQAKWTGKFRLTCNPKMSHWLRYWVDWYLDDDGYPIPEKDGVVRYFFVAGELITDVVFGATKKEVYEKCKNQIDGILRNMNKNGQTIYTYKDLIRSTTFYSGNLADNRAVLEKDPGYIGSVAAMGERQAQANLAGCWNVDDGDDNSVIKKTKAKEICDNDPQCNNEFWLTCDLADTGTDNCVILVWNGLHIIDYMILEKSTPAQNCAMIEHMAAKYGIGDSHIIYDAQRAAYMIDSFPGAMGYLSFKPATGIYRRIGERLKDINYLRLVELVNNNRISMAPEVYNAPYSHQNRGTITFGEEFVKECGCVMFDMTNSGKYKLPPKKAMNRMLGGHASTDLLDAITMRFTPMVNHEYGQELAPDISKYKPRNYSDKNVLNSIYEDSNWF